MTLAELRLCEAGKNVQNPEQQISRQGKGPAVSTSGWRRSAAVAPARGCEPFGSRVVRMGFARWGQVEKALAIQKMLDRNGVHRLIGLIMVEMGMIDTTQLLSVLKTYELEREERL